MILRLSPLVACFALVGCAAPTDDEATPPDETTAQSEDEVRIGDCRSTTGESGKLYSFEGGNFRVCWVRAGGPFGSADNYYQVRNATGTTQRVVVRIDNWPDTRCMTIAPGGLNTDHVGGTRFGMGTPTGIRHC